MNGPWVENADGDLTSESHNRAYATLTGREEMAFESGLEAGLTPEVIHGKIASAYQNTFPNSTLVQTLAENRNGSQRERIMESRSDFYGRVPPVIEGALSTPDGDFHAALWNAALLTDDGLRTELCQELCKAYLERSPGSAREFAEAIHIPENLRVIFESQPGK